MNDIFWIFIHGTWLILVMGRGGGGIFFLEWTTLDEWNKNIDDISWMNFVSSSNFMNVHQ
jgi:hypothetical protein